MTSKTSKTSTLKVTADSIEGTVAELTRGDRLRINGKKVGQPEMSVLARLGIAVEVGVAERPDGQRGPAPKIYALPTTGQFAAARRK